ncbi:NAD(P)/FAD-dependent oxidoreductase [Methylocystis parvus]|uniref:NAD(P)/FAD-dependent oxidoreductase n=1 Tax=Methylocystis parvus TaxID=134 RepID=UPI003C766F55
MAASSLNKRLKVAVLGAGVAGLSASWLLSGAHDVTVFEQGDYAGGHSNTVDVMGPDGAIAVDTGFIVYNEPAYPNLTGLFRHLDVATNPTEMTFAVSIANGALEYAGNDLFTLFAQKKNIVSRRFWSMLLDIRRFYAEAPGHIARMDGMTLGEYLDAHRYGAPFREDHLYPMAAAIWSLPARDVAAYPAKAFTRFCENHGLLKIAGRPLWRTVAGGSREYVRKLIAPVGERVLLNAPIQRVTRDADGVTVEWPGGSRRFDHVVIAAHADQALGMLADPSAEETRLLSCFKYSRNETILHGDARLMPKLRSIWSSWNYLASGPDAPLCVTYWMNRLQGLEPSTPLFVTLNAMTPPREDLIYRRFVYEHPIFDLAAIDAQRELWSLQGVRRTWFCGAYFGAGFHEDGLQAGLAVAEQLGGVRRPWTVENESSRIHVGPAPMA